MSTLLAPAKLRFHRRATDKPISNLILGFTAALLLVGCGSDPAPSGAQTDAGQVNTEDGSAPQDAANGTNGTNDSGSATTDAGTSDSGPADAGTPDTWAAQLAKFVPTQGHESALGDGWMAAGQPSKSRLLDVVAQGATVVTLRYKSEDPFDEKKLVEDNGGTFVRYGVQPSQYNDKAFRTALWDLYDKWQADGGLVYLHCASSNRVGGSWAMYQFERKGVSANEAYELGKAAGMTSTSAIVKKVLGL
ncbi:MAG: hypothetical protein KC502_15700 [Myxococcales bacterium]|nr:hypothetical protein [Myxococcales bacterium]